MRNVLRKLSGVGVAAILGVSLYFTLTWGAEGLRMLGSPTYGLDDAWRSQYVFAIGHLLGLAPLGLIKLAAFFATLKLAVAAILAIYAIGRLRSLPRGHAGSAQMLEAGLILVVAISILTVGPAVWSQNVNIVREYTIQLVLAGLAAALCALERGQMRAATKTPAPIVEAAAPPAATWFSPWR
jgi:hypothetical protein